MWQKCQIGQNKWCSLENKMHQTVSDWFLVVFLLLLLSWVKLKVPHSTQRNASNTLTSKPYLCDEVVQLFGWCCLHAAAAACCSLQVDCFVYPVRGRSLYSICHFAMVSFFPVLLFDFRLEIWSVLTFHEQQNSKLKKQQTKRPLVHNNSMLNLLYSNNIK